MNRARPIIAVTGPDFGGDAAWLFTRVAIMLAGGHALRVTPRRPLRNIDRIDGLVIGGGADVDPTLYGEELLHVVQARQPGQSWSRFMLNLFVFPVTWLLRKTSACCSPAGGDGARDRLELDLIKQAVARRLPILGICRGQQLLNVFFGGSLHQHIKGFYIEEPEVRTILPRKRIELSEGSRFQDIVGARPMRVNALHSHAIDRLAPGLRVAARDRNGIVQAIEHESLPLVLGVQWHPEYLPQLPRQRAIFAALIRAASDAARERSVCQPTSSTTSADTSSSSKARWASRPRRASSPQPPRRMRSFRSSEASSSPTPFARPPSSVPSRSHPRPSSD